MSDSAPIPALKTRLCVMMFLQFFVWGAWYVTTGPFLGKQGWAIGGDVYALCPIAAMISPIFKQVISSERSMGMGGRSVTVGAILGGARRSPSMCAGLFWLRSTDATPVLVQKEIVLRVSDTVRQVSSAPRSPSRWPRARTSTARPSWSSRASCARARRTTPSTSPTR